MRGCFAVAIMLLAACRGGVSSRPSRTTPVILISVDTLRSDHLPAYGYKGVETPRLDELRKDSILFERAYSQCPLTLPSHMTMLTGLLPADHGVRDNIGFSLGAKTQTLAEALKKNGYETGAAVSAFVLRRESGISRGFDFYDDEVEPLGASQVIGRVQRDGADTARIAKSWLDKQNGDKPFFFFMHLYDPHSPYKPPSPFKSDYDGEIAYVDQIVGDFLTYLKQRDLYDKSMIVFVSDHGEGLNEHGEEEHGIFLYREALQVPLFVKLPKSAGGGKSVSVPVELTDVFPTIVEQTATPNAPPHGNARSLLSLLGGDAPKREIYSETFYPRFHFGWSDLHSLIDGDHHYIRAPIPELYDVKNDPSEKKNTIEENRRTYVAMRNAIEPYVKQASAPTAIDPEEAAKLAALGYVGSTVSSSPDEALPDPKTTIDVFRQIRVAFTYYRDDKLAEALALTNKLLADNRRILDLWDVKSKTLQKLGRNAEAIEAAKQGLRVQPNAIALMTAIANLSMLEGKLDEAQQHAELMLKSEPGQAHEIMARIAAQRGDFARAQKEGEEAAAKMSDPTAALQTLGLISKQRGDMQAAMKYLDQALARVAQKRNKRVPNLHLYRGDILARLGRNQEAETEFRREIGLYPKQPDAYASLILLLSAEHRVDEATNLVFTLVKESPNPPSYVAISETLKAIGDDRGSMYWAYQGLQKYPHDPELQRLLRGGRRVS